MIGSTCSIGSSSGPTLASLAELKDELMTLKDAIFVARDSYFDLIRQVSTNIVSPAKPHCGSERFQSLDKM